MAFSIFLSDQEIQTIADAVLIGELGRSGFAHAEVRSGRDHDGDEAIFVKAVLKTTEEILPPQLFTRAYEALDNTLQARGEMRFPYFSVERADDLLGDEAHPSNPA